ncbi:MAG: cytosine permease [Synergistaceae bacterium]|jgi:cytosine permease|nr:cytosine permease [Synergistaceae bacterium]
MTQDNTTTEFVNDDNPMYEVPLDKRQHWLVPAMIFGGCEFCIPILMVGAMLTPSFSLKAILPVLFLSFIVIQWGGNALSGYIGAKTGRTASVVARCAFGSLQARIIIATVILFTMAGWWSVQTSVAGNSFCAMFGIDYNDPANHIKWSLIVLIAGVSFAIPSVLGYSSMKWTDYLAVPGGLILVVMGLYLGVTHSGGIDALLRYEPSEATMSIATAISVILGMNITQWVYAPDYTRYAKPAIRDNLMIPLVGIIAVGVPLIYVGAIMSVGQNTGDIVQVMVNLGFPFWGFLILWLSTWTSQLVNNYSMGLAFSNLLNAKTNKGRMTLTVIGTIISLAASLLGLLKYFEDFLYMSGVCYSPIATVIFSDFLMRKRNWENHEGWNWVATVAIAVGIWLGFYTTYVKPMGIPVVQCLVVTAIVYVAGMKLKAAIKPDCFTEGIFVGK